MIFETFKHTYIRAINSIFFTKDNPQHRGYWEENIKSKFLHQLRSVVW